MSTLIKALVAQMLGLTIAVMLVWLSPALFHGTARLAMLQGAAAASCSRLLRQPPWWLPIHFLFLPTAITLLTLQLPSWLYPVASLLLALVFWGTVKGDVPLFLSSPAAAAALAVIVERENTRCFAELGAGVGSMVVPLAQRRPMMAIDAFEHAPLPWLITRWRCRKRPNVNTRVTSFWSGELSRYDTVFAFLSPAVMPKLGEKISREMRPGNLFISSSFPVPGWRPESVIRINDRRKTAFFCYRVK